MSPPAVTLSVSYNTNNTVTFAGTLKDIDFAGGVVTLTGIPQGFATTDSYGNFNLTTAAPPIGTTVVATETDLWGSVPTRLAPS